MRPAQRNSRKPLTVVLFQRLCLCSWVASAAVREQDRTSRTEQNSPSTTHTMLLRWYHAWYHGMSRTGCMGRHASHILPHGSKQPSETCSITTKSSSCNLCCSSARSLQTMLQDDVPFLYTLRVMHPLYTASAALAGSAYVSRPDRGQLNEPPSALCALHACQGCLVGAAIARSFIPMRACACMPPCVSRWH